MNAQLELEKVLKELVSQCSKDTDNKKIPPKLLLHSCCAPCSTYVLEYLSEYFEIIIYYYNPNIFPLGEYEKRAKEQQYLISKMSTRYPMSCLVGDYESERFYELARGLEDEPECGRRCDRCYELRLRKTGELAKKLGVDYFSTTLTISPLKKADKLNEIGKQLEEELGVTYLVSDFKKKNGYKRSTELSKEYDLYRQDFCGCIYSKMEREQMNKIRMEK
ncbi:MAG: epoxyqueuosine reductase QueH [Eubacteriales bacterium]